MTAPARPKQSWMDLFLGTVERVGNLLPHPATLFAMLAGCVVVASALAAWLEVSAVLPGTDAAIEPVNLLTYAGLHRMLTEMVTNFTGFAPLGTVLVAMLGVGVAESSGLIGALLRSLVLSAPRNLLTVVIVFAGVLSNFASELGYVLLVPLAATIFLAAGRHPIAGLAAGFAGVSGGYSANLLIGTVDPLLSGLSTEAARLAGPSFAAYEVNPTANWYFMIVSTFVITAAGTWVTEKIVVPRLGKYEGDGRGEGIKQLTADERRGLWFAGIVTIVCVFVILLGLIPEAGFLRNLDTPGDIMKSPMLKGVVAFIFLLGLLIGIAYGIGARTFKNDSDVVKGMGVAMERLGIYMVLVFFAAQFVAYFKWSNLGLIIAVKGAEILKETGLPAIPMMIGFVLLSGFLNLFMGSASAKWAIMAPVFIPMFMLLGYTPELTQTAYRIGDSTTNIIAPMMSYFALIIAFFQTYDRKAGIGTLIATMLPYTITFMFCWIILLVIWMSFGWPVGPGAPLYLPQP